MLYIVFFCHCFPNVVAAQSKKKKYTHTPNSIKQLRMRINDVSTWKARQDNTQNALDVGMSARNPICRRMKKKNPRERQMCRIEKNNTLMHKNIFFCSKCFRISQFHKCEHNRSESFELATGKHWKKNISCTVIPILEGKKNLLRSKTHTALLCSRCWYAFNRKQKPQQCTYRLQCCCYARHELK